MIKMLHEKGITSEHAWMAVLASNAMAVASWLRTDQGRSRGIERADRWGIFIGEWARCSTASVTPANCKRESEQVRSEVDAMIGQPQTATSRQAVADDERDADETRHGARHTACRRRSLAAPPGGRTSRFPAPTRWLRSWTPSCG